MLETSKAYNPYTDTRKCGILVTFEMVDVDAAKTAVASATDKCEMSKVNQTHNRIENMEKKYAMLEKDYWGLDGSFELPQKSYIPHEQTGWWSKEISDNDGTFSTPPNLYLHGLPSNRV